MRSAKSSRFVCHGPPEKFWPCLIDSAMPRTFKTTLVHAVMNALIQQYERQCMGTTSGVNSHKWSSVAPLVVRFIVRRDACMCIPSHVCWTLLVPDLCHHIGCMHHQQSFRVYRALRDASAGWSGWRNSISPASNPQHTRFVSWWCAHLCMCRCPHFRWEMQCRM